jgi:hypothetical protein
MALASQRHPLRSNALSGLDLDVMCLASSVQQRYDWVEVILGGRFDAGHGGGYETLNRPDDCRHLC